MIYSCRAEWPGDVARILDIATLWSLRIKPLWSADPAAPPPDVEFPGPLTCATDVLHCVEWFRALRVLPDVGIEFVSTLDLLGLKALFELVEDTHVMRETLRACPLSDNDLEREYESADDEE